MSICPICYEEEDITKVSMEEEGYSEVYQCMCNQCGQFWFSFFEGVVH